MCDQATVQPCERQLQSFSSCSVAALTDGLFRFVWVIGLSFATPHHNGIIFYEHVPLLRNGTALEEYNAYDVIIKTLTKEIQ